jgi:hypothetical protein
MNQLAHVFITYSILFFVIPDVKEYFLFVAIFATILDLDHLPGYIKLLFMTKKQRRKMKLKDYVGWFRTAIQEPIGIFTIEVVLFLFYLFGVKSIYLLIAAYSFFIHWLIDFLTVHTRPFDPINKKIISIVFHSGRQRQVSEVVITVLSGIVFLILFFWV